MWKYLAIIVAVVLALAAWPINFEPPSQLHVWVNPAAGEYCCDNAVRMSIDDSQTRGRRPGFDVRRAYADVRRDRSLRPCGDCAEARCLEMRVPLLGLIACRLKGHKIREKWNVVGPDQVLSWPYTYHRADGSPVDECYRSSDLRSSRDPDAWFRRLGRAIR